MRAYTQDFTGFRELQNHFKNYSNLYTKVGVLSDETYEGENITIAGVAAVNEFGTKDGHIPPRPFMANALKENKEEIKKMTLALFKRSTMGKLKLTQAISLLGEFFTNKVQETIRKFDSPPNAPATIKAKKGQDNPLIDQGRLIQSITHKEVII